MINRNDLAFTHLLLEYMYCISIICCVWTITSAHLVQVAILMRKIVKVYTVYKLGFQEKWPLASLFDEAFV